MPALAVLWFWSAGTGIAALAPGSDLPDPNPIYGGAANGECQFPQAVQVGTCTGTLIHPQIVTTAQHCRGGGMAVRFGEDMSNPEKTVRATCKKYPSFESYEEDAMYCLLDEPVLDVPFTPPLMGCETEALHEGAEVWISGFGGSDSNDGADKHFVQTKITGVRELSVRLGEGGRSPCHGDSGGPGFVQLDDGSWRAFGIVHGRGDLWGGNPFDPPNGPVCGVFADYVRIDAYVEWIESDSGIDVTPCHDADGTWNPGPECGGFPLRIHEVSASWQNMCQGAVPSGLSETCGAPYGSAPGTTTTDGSSTGTSADAGTEAPASEGSGGEAAGVTGGDVGTKDGGSGAAGDEAPSTEPATGAGSPADEDSFGDGGCRASNPTMWALLLPVLAWRRSRLRPR